MTASQRQKETQSRKERQARTEAAAAGSHGLLDDDGLEELADIEMDTQEEIVLFENANRIRAMGVAGTGAGGRPSSKLSLPDD